MPVMAVPVYLTFEETQRILWSCQEKVLSLDEDLEASKQIQDLTARYAARKALADQRDMYQEMIRKLDDATEQFRAEADDAQDDS